MGSVISQMFSFCNTEKYGAFNCLICVSLQHWPAQPTVTMNCVLTLVAWTVPTWSCPAPAPPNALRAASVTLALCQTEARVCLWIPVDAFMKANIWRCRNFYPSRNSYFSWDRNNIHWVCFPINITHFTSKVTFLCHMLHNCKKLPLKIWN